MARSDFETSDLVKLLVAHIAPPCMSCVAISTAPAVAADRYTADIELKTVVGEDEYKSDRPEVRKSVKKVFEEKYLNQAAIKSEKKASGSKYFFAKLNF